MISPAKYENINANSRVNFNEPSPKTGSFSSQVVSICNLPVELKQKIASSLDSKDYASLRATGKAMSESLDCFSVMNDKLKQGVSGDAEKNIQEIMRDKLIRNLLDGDQKKEITLALKNCFSRPHEIFEGCTTVGTEYLPDNHKDRHQDCISRAIDSCRCGITKFIPSGGSRSFTPDLYPGELWNAKVNFSDSDINKESLGDIFSSFNKVYQNTESSEKFVVAHLASILRNYWAEVPPSSVNKNDINYVSDAYPRLFRAGDNVLKLLRE